MVRDTITTEPKKGAEGYGEATESPVVSDTITTEPKNGAEGYNTKIQANQRRYD